MKFIKRSTRRAPKLSLVLLDWSVRESFHLLNYLAQQTADRESFEVVVVEYYSRASEAVRRFEDQVDTWVVLEMPESCYYHKHLMYNVGIVLSRGDIVMIGDADAMVKPTFVDRIIAAFRQNADIVYHLDQFRNVRRDLYPFNFPTFKVVEGAGCVNARDGKTSGVLDDQDPVHSRNYGACMCARRADLIRIGGADEHIDYLGHICGPYELTFRLCNIGHREIWDTEEFMYHTWHPGSAGADNHLGPHDGRHMSTTALEALISGRSEPLVKNGAIKLLRAGAAGGIDHVLGRLIDPDRIRSWNVEALRGSPVLRSVPGKLVPVELYRGYRLVDKAGEIAAYRARERSRPLRPESDSPVAVGRTVEEVRHKVDRLAPPSAWFIERAAVAYAYAWRMLDSIRYRAQLGFTAIPVGAKMIVIGAVALPGAVLAWLFVPGRAAKMMSRIIYDARREAATLTNLATTVLQQAGSEASETPAVIVQGRRLLAFLMVLKVLGILGRAQILMIRTGRDLAASVDRLEKDGAHGPVIVSAQLFTRFYARLLNCKVAARMVIA